MYVPDAGTDGAVELNAFKTIQYPRPFAGGFNAKNVKIHFIYPFYYAGKIRIAQVGMNLHFGESLAAILNCARPAIIEIFVLSF
jgi:hypothetical protein